MKERDPVLLHGTEAEQFASRRREASQNKKKHIS
jgi:hypothetical protein